MSSFPLLGPGKPMSARVPTVIRISGKKSQGKARRKGIGLSAWNYRHSVAEEPSSKPRRRQPCTYLEDFVT